ncbi:MAG: phytanoyl-CoA dioxygenase family protein [Rubripirellula sp.]
MLGDEKAFEIWNPLGLPKKSFEMCDQRLSHDQIDKFRRTGHLTVPDVFDDATIRAVLADLSNWSQQFLETLPENRRTWYLEGDEQRSQLRKLDHPVFNRPAFAELARDPQLIDRVQQLIGEGVHVFFSQVFMKPPEVGGPKPIHQDNFYFGPDDHNATLTVWIALDDATIQNGCLRYGDRHLDHVIPHFAPEGEPFNLQIDGVAAEDYSMSPAPVSSGGVSFHHGNSLHQSSANTSDQPRRAVAFHYLRNDARLIHPALDYDPKLCVPVT